MTARDVRNLARVDLELPADGIAIVGENGQGKTNLLEAIAYTHLVRSVRGARDVDVTRFGAPGFAIAATAVAGGSERAVTVNFERAGRRKWATIDGAPAERLSDAIGAIPSVTISPVDVALVRGAPAERRRYLDVVLATTSRRYLSALQAYRSALVRRNAVLRAGGLGGGRSARAVEAAAAVWEPPLAEAGAVVRAERAAWVARWRATFARLAAAIGERGAITLRYAWSAGGEGGQDAGAIADVAECRERLVAALAADRPADVRRGATRPGPHRNDLMIAIDDRALPAFGSAGQHRTIAIAMRLIEAATLHASSGARPVLLLDDPFAELDDRRARATLDLVCRGVDAAPPAGQVLLAVPRASDIPPVLVGLERWRIAEGVLTRTGGDEPA